MSFQTLSPDFRESLRQMADGLCRPVQIKTAGFDPSEEAFQRAVQRRNVEPDGRIWRRGQPIWPSEADYKILEAGMSEEIEKMEARLKKLEALPDDATADQVRAHLSADARDYRKSDAIHSTKMILQDRRQYLYDYMVAVRHNAAKESKDQPGVPMKSMSGEK